MATSDSPLSVPDVTLAVARLSGSGSLPGNSSGSGISVSWTGKEIGDTLTITTSSLDFTSKANAAPLWYVDPGAEGTVDASPLSRLNVSLSGRALGNLDTETKHGPNGAAKAELVGTSPGWQVMTGSLGPKQGEILTDVDGAGNHIRVISRLRRNFNGQDAYAKHDELLGLSGSLWNIKRWRWWSTAAENNDVVLAVGQSNTTHGGPRFTTERTGTGSDYPDGATFNRELFGMGKDQWIEEFIDIKQSSVAGVRDGFYRHVSKGQEYVYQNMGTLDSDDQSGRYSEFVMEQWQFIYTDVPFILWHDHIYVDDTPHAVVVTDKPTWGEPNEIIDPVIPTAWSSTEITAKARCSLSGRYLYVFDGGGNLLNSNGVAL